MRIDPGTFSFKTDYDYGPFEQTIKPQSPLTLLVNKIALFPLKPLIFPGASILKPIWQDPKVLEFLKFQLIEIGGQSITLKTPDGDILEGMHIAAKDFKTVLEYYCDYHEVDADNDMVEQFLTIKDKFYIEEREKEEDCLLDELFPTVLMPNDKAMNFIEQSVEPLGLDYKVHNTTTETGVLKRNYEISLGLIPKNLSKVDKISPNSSHPTVLIVPGATASYLYYNRTAVGYLLKGLDVMMIDHRGTGESEGSPTAYKTKLDLEAAYQYLHKVKGIENEDMLVHGHCMGVGAGSDLAVRRKGVNIVFDRTFASYHSLVGGKVPGIGAIIEIALSYIAYYNNAENLSQIEGHIGIVKSKNDKLISNEEHAKLIEKMPKSKNTQVVSFMETQKGHRNAMWMNDPTISEDFNRFLEKSNLRRKLFQ